MSINVWLHGQRVTYDYTTISSQKYRNHAEDVHFRDYADPPRRILSDALFKSSQCKTQTADQG